MQDRLGWHYKTKENDRIFNAPLGKLENVFLPKMEMHLEVRETKGKVEIFQVLTYCV